MKIRQVEAIIDEDWLRAFQYGVDIALYRVNWRVDQGMKVDEAIRETLREFHSLVDIQQYLRKRATGAVPVDYVQ